MQEQNVCAIKLEVGRHVVLHRRADAACVPQRSGQSAELRLIVRKARRFDRLGADDFRSGTHELIDLSQQIQRHAATAAAEIQDPITHPARRDELAIRHTQLLENDIVVDEVETEAAWRILWLQPGKRRFLPIEVGDVRNEPALLQQERVARQVIDPRPRLLRPRLCATEVLAQRRAQRHARTPIRQRLMHGRVHDDAIDAQRKLQVGDGLQIARRERPRVTECRQRLGCSDVLSVNMRDRGGAEVIEDVRGLRLVAARIRPHRCHRNVRVAAHCHVIAQRRPLVFERFAVKRESPLARGLP
jgi:hypothetical protein